MRLRYSTVIAPFLLMIVGLLIALTTNTFQDFFIYRVAAKLAWQGDNPYDLAAIREQVGDQFPEPNPKPESFVNNCGYFLPPQALVLYLPFALVPYGTAKCLWAVLIGIAALAIARLPFVFLKDRNSLPGDLIPFALLLNFVTLSVVVVGQTTPVTLGAVALGLLLRERTGKAAFLLSCFVWSIPFVKPHVALALLPLIAYLHNGKRVVGVLGMVLLLNGVGAILVGGTPLFLADYLEFTRSHHRAVLFNRAELNFEMTSWNRLLYVLSGEEILVEQSSTITLLSYFVFFAVATTRVVLSRLRPAVSWVAAVSGVAAVFCPQVLAYESLTLFLIVPWIVELFMARLFMFAFMATGLLTLEMVPFHFLQSIGVECHRPVGVGLLALLVLVGPTTFSRER